MNEIVSSEEIGKFVDSIAGNSRTTSAVAGRLIEEVVELGLAAGLTAGQILAHVTDSLYNQSIKASHQSGKTVFPSRLVASCGDADHDEMADECADVSLILKDLCYIAKVDLHPIERRKFEGKRGYLRGQASRKVIVKSARTGETL